MIFRLIRQDADEALLSASRELLLLPGERAALFEVDQEGEAMSLRRLIGERRLRGPARCGSLRREIGARAGDD